MAASPSTSDLRIVLFGKSHEETTMLSHAITGTKHHPKPSKQSVHMSGEWRNKHFSLVKMPNVFGPSSNQNQVRHSMKVCVACCNPGPNVLLLLLKHSDFTEQDRKTLVFIMSLFGRNTVKYTMIVTPRNDRGASASLQQFLRYCGQTEHNISLDLSGDDLQEVMETMEKRVNENRGKYLTFDEDTDPIEEPGGVKLPLNQVLCVKPPLNQVLCVKPPLNQVLCVKPPLNQVLCVKLPLNLVLCGQHGAWKTSAANAILGERKFVSPAVSECVRHQGVVCGRHVNLVDLPVLYRKPLEAARRESFKSIKLSTPEGVHAFILVLPLAPPTNEDREEVNIIRNMFSVQVKDFTMIMFTVEGSVKPKEVLSFLRKRDIQELIRSCGDRYVVFNIEQQGSEVLDTVEKVMPAGSRSFKQEMIARPRSISFRKPKCYKHSDRTLSRLVQVREPLKMVLIGMTGSGKSATGNTILHGARFHSKLSMNSVTRLCKKETGLVDGRPVVVVDTPGLFDTSLTNETIKQELLQCFCMLAPGPHAIVLVMKIGRMTPQERAAVELVKTFFGERSENFIIILFTGGDFLKGQTVESFLEEGSHTFVKELMSVCGGRYHVFNNEDQSNRAQVSQLLQKVDSMVKANGGGHYTSEMFQEAEAAIEKEKQRIMIQKKSERAAGTEDKTTKAAENQTYLAELTEHLKEKQAEIKRESIYRKKEEVTRKEQEEARQRLWVRRTESIQQKIIYGSQRKTSPNKMLLTSNIEDLRKEREAWEKERREWWEQRRAEEEQRQKEEQAILKKLREYEQEIEMYENEMEKDDELSREVAERQTKGEDVNVKNREEKEEAEARKEAEAQNEFTRRYGKEVAARMEKMREEMEGLKMRQDQQNYFMIQQLKKKKSCKQDLARLTKQQEQEMNDLMETHKFLRKEVLEVEMEEMRKMHTDEIIDWIDKHVKKSRNACAVS